MKLRFPDTAQGQIIAILICALLATFGLIELFMRVSRPDIPPLPPGPWANALRVAAVVESLHAVPPELRESVAREMSDEGIRVEIGAQAACTAEPYSHAGRGVRDVLGGLLGERFGRVVFSECEGEPGRVDMIRIGVPLDGVTITVRAITPRSLSQIVMVTLPLMVGIAFLLILMVSLSLWALWRINRPLRLLAGAVDQFGRDVAVAPLPEVGPREFRRLARTFNRMEHRITQLIEERSQMLMAVGHDLRTPLTRLKLGMELDEALATRRDLLGELDLMQRMINGALSFLDNRRDTEAFEVVDLGALVESICIGFADSGKDVTYEGGYGVNCPCQPTAMTRAVNNLIENACRYGSRVVADVRREDRFAVIDIRDDGPGIPEEKRGIVLEPFVRLDVARASDGGMGLGLSIVNDVVRRHDGSMTLLDASQGGLLVRIRLPLAGE